MEYTTEPDFVYGVSSLNSPINQSSYTDDQKPKKLPIGVNKTDSANKHDSTNKSDRLLDYHNIKPLNNPLLNTTLDNFPLVDNNTKPYNRLYNANLPNTYILDDYPIVVRPKRGNLSSITTFLNQMDSINKQLIVEEHQNLKMLQLLDSIDNKLTQLLNQNVKSKNNH